MRMRCTTLLLLVSPCVLLVAAAYLQWGTVGLPALPPSPPLTPETAAEPYGFPAWLRITHYVNLLFLILLIRSGLQSLMDHPRLYWKVHCTPGTDYHDDIRRAAELKPQGIHAEAGAIRDVVQNHMFQVIACLAMECPTGKDHEARRDERGRLLKTVRTLDPSNVMRSQFRGYRREPGVAPDSQVETFAAIRFYIDNERWNGVPFYMRVGKCLPVTATEVLVRFKRPLRPVKVPSRTI